MGKKKPANKQETPIAQKQISGTNTDPSTFSSPKRLDFSLNIPKPDSQEVDFKSFLTENVSKQTSFPWSEICLGPTFKPEADWIRVMNKHRECGPDTSLHLSEKDVCHLFELEDEYDDADMKKASQFIVRNLQIRKNYLKKMEEDKQNNERQLKHMNKRIQSLPNKPTLRLGHLINDLYYFELYCENKNVEQTDILTLLAYCVDPEKSVIIHNRIADARFKGKTWNESKQAILLSLDTSKNLEHYRQEVRNLTPKHGETVYKYHNRFYAYVSILQMEPTEAASIFLLTLPEFARRELHKQLAPKPNCEPVTWTVKHMMDFLSAWLQPSETSVYYKSNATPKSEIAKISLEVRKDRLLNKIRKPHKFPPKTAIDEDNQIIHCWKCDKKATKANGGHYQPQCKAKDSDRVKENKYRPPSLKLKSSYPPKTIKLNKMEFLQVQKGNREEPAQDSEDDDSLYYAQGEEEEEDEGEENPNKIDDQDGLYYE
ncbi:hypothetical protein AKO1_006541, partial [Acrasis kona]